MPFWATRVTQERRSAGMLAEPGQLVVHPGDGPGGQRPRRALQPPQRCLGRRAVAHPTAHASSVSRASAGRGEWSGEQFPRTAARSSPVRVPRRAVPAAVATVAGCLVVLALLGAGVRTHFGPQLRLDGVVSEALYAGDHRAVALNDLLAVLTAPGLSWFRFVVFLPVLVLLLRRRAWWTAAWVVTAVALIGPLNTLLKNYFGRVRPDFAEGGARLDSLSYPERALLGHRHPGHRRAGAGLAAAGRARPALGARGRRRAGPARRADPHVAGRPLPVRRRRRLGARRGLEPADGAAVRGVRRGPGGAAADVVSGLDQRIVLAPTDGSLGPLLRIADDRLAPGAGYGRHEHRDVDVVAVVLAGSLRHSWGGGAELRPATSRSCGPARGSTHDEVAGDDGARVLQCYLRSAEPGRAAVARGAPRRGRAGSTCGRPDARLWLAGRGRGRRRRARRGCSSSGASTACSSSSRTAGRWRARARCWSGSSTPGGPAWADG